MHKYILHSIGLLLNRVADYGDDYNDHGRLNTSVFAFRGAIVDTVCMEDIAKLAFAYMHGYCPMKSLRGEKGSLVYIVVDAGVLQASLYL